MPQRNLEVARRETGAAAEAREQPSSRINVEIVRASWEAWRRRDMEALFDFYDPAIEWDMTRSNVPDMGVCYGHEGVRAFFREWSGPQHLYLVPPTRTGQSQRERIARAAGSLRGLPRRSGGVHRRRRERDRPRQARRTRKRQCRRRGDACSSAALQAPRRSSGPGRDLPRRNRSPRSRAASEAMTMHRRDGRDT
jgi:ketosteroid isomerase-like protein